MSAFSDAVVAASMFFWRVSSNCWLYLLMREVATPIAVLIAMIAMPTGFVIMAVLMLTPSPFIAAERLNVLAVAAPCAVACVSVVLINPSWANLASRCSSSKSFNCKISISWDFSNFLFARTCFNCASVRLTHESFNTFNASAYCVVLFAKLDIPFTAFNAFP